MKDESMEAEEHEVRAAQRLARLLEAGERSAGGAEAAELERAPGEAEDLAGELQAAELLRELGRQQRRRELGGAPEGEASALSEESFAGGRARLLAELAAPRGAASEGPRSERARRSAWVWALPISCAAAAALWLVSPAEREHRELLREEQAVPAYAAAPEAAEGSSFPAADRARPQPSAQAKQSPPSSSGGRPRPATAAPLEVPAPPAAAGGAVAGPSRLPRAKGSLAKRVQRKARRLPPKAAGRAVARGSARSDRLEEDAEGAGQLARPAPAAPAGAAEPPRAASRALPGVADRASARALEVGSRAGNVAPRAKAEAARPSPSEDLAAELKRAEHGLAGDCPSATRRATRICELSGRACRRPGVGDAATRAAALCRAARSSCQRAGSLREQRCRAE